MIDEVDEVLVVKDPWRKTILAERGQNKVQAEMRHSLRELHGNKQSALILGDACLLNSQYLLEVAKFTTVVNVDSSPTLLDDIIVPLSDKRLIRVMKPFDEVFIEPLRYDYVYGKSIAFNPNATIFRLMENITAGLRPQGVFCAIWAGKGDTFRPMHYSESELRKLYDAVGLEIIALKETPITPVKGLLDYGVCHEIMITAVKTK